MQVWKAQIEIVCVCDSWLGYRSMTCWTCEQQLRQSAMHLRRRISESISIAVCSMHDYDEDRTEQLYAVSVKFEAELAVDVL